MKEYFPDAGLLQDPLPEGHTPQEHAAAEWLRSHLEKAPGRTRVPVEQVRTTMGLVLRAARETCGLTPQNLADQLSAILPHRNKFLRQKFVRRNEKRCSTPLVTGFAAFAAALKTSPSVIVLAGQTLATRAQGSSSATLEEAQDLLVKLRASTGRAPVPWYGKQAEISLIPPMFKKGLAFAIQENNCNSELRRTTIANRYSEKFGSRMSSPSLLQIEYGYASPSLDCLAGLCVVAGEQPVHRLMSVAEEAVRASFQSPQEHLEQLRVIMAETQRKVDAGTLPSRVIPRVRRIIDRLTGKMHRIFLCDARRNKRK